MVVSANSLYRNHLYTSERAASEYPYFTGSGLRKREYHQLWYALSVLLPGRLFILQTLACTEAVRNMRSGDVSS